MRHLCQGWYDSNGTSLTISSKVWDQTGYGCGHDYWSCDSTGHKVCFFSFFLERSTYCFLRRLSLVLRRVPVRLVRSSTTRCPHCTVPILTPSSLCSFVQDRRPHPVPNRSVLKILPRISYVFSIGSTVPSFTVVSTCVEIIHGLDHGRLGTVTLGVGRKGQSTCVRGRTCSPVKSP